MADPRLSIDDIRGAHDRIRDKVNRTPVQVSSTLNDLAGAELFFKCENFQKTGAFKARGATNAVFSLSEEEAQKGVVTHSSGNHAAALARAARLRSIPAFIVMPTTAPLAKQESVRRYGGDVVFCEPTLEAREATAAKIQHKTGATLVHPYNDLRVMAGQGTTAIELMEEVPDLDVIVCPVGGGGHLSGTVVASKAIRPETRVVGAEPQGADDAAESFRSGRITPMPSPNTIADGLRTSLGELTFREIREHVDDIVTVSEEAILNGMRTIWGVMKLVVEPSAAVSYAAVASRALDVHSGKVGIILTGGNLDLDRLPWQDT